MSEGSSKQFIAVLLISAAGLIGIACWLGSLYVTDTDIRHLKVFRERNARGESIGMEAGPEASVSVWKSDSNTLLWRARTPGPFEYLVGDHYLLAIRPGRIEAIDMDEAMDEAMAVPINQPRQLVVQFQRFGYDLDGLKPLTSQRQLHPIPGTNRFLIQIHPSVQLPVGSIFAFEIESRSIRLLSEWNCGSGNAAILPNGNIHYATPDEASVEVRSPTDFEIQRTLPLPSGMRHWATARVHNELLWYKESNNITRVHRVDDFSEVPELNMTHYSSARPEFGPDKRYHLLVDGPFENSRRLVVYDSIARRVAYDSGPAVVFQSAEVVNGQLKIETRAFGRTTKYVDLETLQERLVRPYLWIVLALPCLLTAALVWLVVWIARVACKPNRIPLNILFVSALLLTPLVWRMARAGYSLFDSWRPTVDFSQAVIIALFFYLAVWAAFGNRRAWVRCVPLLFAVVLFFHGLQLFNLIDLQRDNPRSPAARSLRSWLASAIIAAIILGAARFLRFRIGLNRIAADPLRTASRSQIHLLDIFLVTAAFAMSVTVLGPLVDLLLAQEVRLEVLGRSLLLVIASLLGLIALSQSSRLYRAATAAAIFIAMLGIVGTTLQLAFANQRLWLELFTLMRLHGLLFLTVFAFSSIMRNAGFRWTVTVK